jgi:hypothetical protein
MNLFRSAFAASVVLLTLAGCGAVDQANPYLRNSHPQASWQQGPDRWYEPMQLRSDGCYVGSYATEPGTMPQPCPGPAVATQR